MKLRELEVDVRELVTTPKRNEFRTCVRPEDDSPTKRKAMHQRSLTTTLDLTLSDDSEDRRVRIKREEPSSPLGPRSSRNQIEAVGSVPVPLSKFPAKMATDMDVRMLWIEKNMDLGSIEKRFGMVFSCKYIGTTFHRHRRAWRSLRDLELLPPASRELTWKYLISIVKDETSVSLGINPSPSVEPSPVIVGSLTTALKEYIEIGSDSSTPPPMNKPRSSSPEL